ncbi:MAG: adenylate/guanylate cyclase domain-containing protein, partial [Candidatus Brocadiaceae bacterium]|nr:adenylate/guanylate cyclase domain-containing protein [Candidatus Brocadiaceae bacterium]
QVPSDVIVVSIDKLSSEILNQSGKTYQWKRSLHASLIDKLVKAGVAVITFDMVFSETRSKHDDDLFAEAIRNAGNVILCESIKKNVVPLTGNSGVVVGDLNIEQVTQPISSLAQSSFALAPFPLPKVPVTVSQYWVFKKSVRDKPTLPVATFQAFTLNEYEIFIRLLEKIDPFLTNKLPRDKDDIISSNSLVKTIQDIRSIFENEPMIAEKMLEALRVSKQFPVDEKTNQILKSMIHMYQGPGSRYLNFYGYPRTITTIPYYQILKPEDKSATDFKKIDLKNKAVFVGSSTNSQVDQKDGFYTVFSQSSGFDISGVEIAATAFANILEDMHVKPIRFELYITIIFIWGLLLGILCYLFPTVISAPCVVGMIVLYLFSALYQFKAAGAWYPIVVPLIIQAPLAFFGSIVLKYILASRERQNIKDVIRDYLPLQDELVDKVAGNIVSLKTHSQQVYGTCLYTDAEQYTSLSETMEPSELRNYLNKYFEVIFKPVMQHGGMVANVLADSMLATWMADQPDAALRKHACFSALEIDRAVHRFNRPPNATPLPTRIGLHFGELELASLGAKGHYEIRPVGDMVNTSTRIEGLNKYLGTRILVSEEVLDEIDTFLTRELGQFLMVGKATPLMIHELICIRDEADEHQTNLCVLFSESLAAYRKQSWKEAIEKFSNISKRYEEDGPSLFYIKLCEQYYEKQFGESWTGVVRMDRK